MAITDILKTGGTGQRPEGITCPHYDAPPGEKRCRQYLKGGACARPDEFMCVEWLKANGHAVPQADPPATTPKPETVDAGAKRPRPKAATDLFGNPAAESTPAPKVTPGRTDHRRPTADQPEERPPLRGLTTEDIDSFKELGVEVCLRSEAFGEVWLVPEYTGRDRKEITPEHAATICQVLQAFPGSQVVSFEKSPETDKEAEA